MLVSPCLGFSLTDIIIIIIAIIAIIITIIISTIAVPHLSAVWVYNDVISTKITLHRPSSWTTKTITITLIIILYICFLLSHAHCRNWCPHFSWGMSPTTVLLKASDPHWCFPGWNCIDPNQQCTALSAVIALLGLHTYIIITINIIIIIIICYHCASPNYAIN